MTITKTILIAGLASLALTAGAWAAEPYSMPTGAGTMADGFDWEGVYFGVEKGYYFATGEFNPNAVIGYNFMLSDNVVGGVEGSAGVNVFGSGTFLNVQGRGRIGVLAGPDSMLYGAAGIGSIGSTALWSAAGGVEWATGSNMSVRGEAKYVHAFSSPMASAGAFVSLFWHAN